MPQKLTSEYINKRINTLKPSSVEYYLNTPLSELKTREEKMIKKELQNRQLSILNEDIITNTADTTDPDFNKEQADAQIALDNARQSGGVSMTSGEASGDVALNGEISENGAPLYQQIYDQTISWFGSLPDTFSHWFESGSTFVSDVYESIKNYLYNLNIGGRNDAAREEKVKELDAERNDRVENANGLEDFAKINRDDVLNGSSEDIAAKEFPKEKEVKYGWAAPTAGVFAVSVAILAIYAIFKVIKRFIKKDGSVKNENDTETTSESKNPMIDNIGLAVLKEANDEATAESAEDANDVIDKAKGMMGPILQRYANNCIKKLLADEVFVAYMEKEKPELLENLRKYESDNGNDVVSESMDPSTNSDEEVTSTTDNDTSAASDMIDQTDTSSLFSKITGTFSKLGSAIGDGVSSVVNKLKDIDKRLNESPSSLVRWIPTMVKSALAVLVIGALWYKAKDGAMAQLTGESDDTNNEPATSDDKTPELPATTSDEETPAEIAPDDVNSELDNLASDDSSAPSTADSYTSTNSELHESTYFINTSLNAIKLLAEASISLSKTKDKPSKGVFDALTDRGEKLANNIIERAKYVATDLINDRDFVTFSKKKNPDLLKHINCFVNSCGKKSKKKAATTKNKDVKGKASTKSTKTSTKKKNVNKDVDIVDKNVTELK